MGPCFLAADHVSQRAEQLRFPGRLTFSQVVVSLEGVASPLPFLVSGMWDGSCWSVGQPSSHFGAKSAWPSSWWGWGSTIYCQRPRSQQAPMMPDDEGLWDPPATGHRSQKWFQVTPEAGRGDKERAEECESEQSSNRGRGSKARESRASEKLFTWHW